MQEASGRRTGGGGGAYDADANDSQHEEGEGDGKARGRHGLRDGGGVGEAHGGMWCMHEP